MCSISRCMTSISAPATSRMSIAPRRPALGARPRRGDVGPRWCPDTPRTRAASRRSCVVPAWPLRSAAAQARPPAKPVRRRPRAGDGNAGRSRDRAHAMKKFVIERDDRLLASRRVVTAPLPSIESVPIPVAIVTGSGGLIGSESVRHLVESGYDVIGLENDMRARFFGPSASTAPHDAAAARRSTRASFARSSSTSATRTASWASYVSTRAGSRAAGARRGAAVSRLGGVRRADGLQRKCERHDEPAGGRSPLQARGDVHLHVDEQGLRRSSRIACRSTRPRRVSSCPRTTSTSAGIDTTMSIDQCTHSLFGVSKIAADVMVQEYGHYFGMPTVCFRGGCLTGPSHAGAKLHGFLSYLMQCTVTGEPVHDLRLRRQAGARQHSFRRRRQGVRRFSPRIRNAPRSTTSAAGARAMSRCSRRSRCASGSPAASSTTSSPIEARIGDHRWYISDFSDFERDYPEFKLEYGIEAVLREIHDVNVDQWAAAAAA